MKKRKRNKSKEKENYQKQNTVETIKGIRGIDKEREIYCEKDYEKNERGKSKKTISRKETRLEIRK